MTYAEVCTMIESFGLPYSYYQFPKGTDIAPPFICFYYTGSDDMGADDTNYQKIRDVVIELYTDFKDIEKEEAIETALKEAEIFYQKEETFIDSEQLYLAVFSFQIVVTEELTQEENNNG